MTTIKKQRYTLFQRFLHKLVSLRLVLLFLPFTVHHIDKLFLKLSAGRTSLSQLMAGLPVAAVTTTGAKSGLPRTLPIMVIPDPQDDARLIMLATNWGQSANPNWYYNLKAKPAATCVLNGQTADYAAQEITGADYDKYWQIALDTYSGYALYRKLVKTRRIPILLMTPVKP
jgi:deazaflavin-dependent oxidoreductase (nitroreductase family)